MPTTEPETLSTKFPITMPSQSSFPTLQYETDRRMADALGRSHPGLRDCFLSHLDRGHRGILHRFLQAVVRENIADVARGLSWTPDNQTLLMSLGGIGMVRIPVRRKLSLGRFDIDGDVTLHQEHHVTTLVHPCQFLDLLRRMKPARSEAESESYARLASEMEESAAHYGLALAGEDRRRKDFFNAAQTACQNNSLSWVESRLSEDAAFSPLIFFEQCVVDGHPLHPSAKIKRGMEVQDIPTYVPEWGAAPGVALVAVALSACQVTSLDGKGPREILEQEYPELRSRVEDHLRKANWAHLDYELIPVHPWQLNNSVPVLHENAIQRGDIVSISGVRIPAAALMSVRSLAPIQRRGERKHHLKTAIAVQLTNAVRTVSPQAAENGPMLTRVLVDVQEREGYFDGQFAVLREDASIYYRSNDDSLTDDRRAELSKNLAAILRENPENHAAEGEIAMPAAALIARSPIGTRSIVSELIERFALNQNTGDLQTSSIEFLRRYARVSVRGFFTLMVRYGIGLEGHLQNAVPIFRLRDGEPLRMLIRDFGGVRVLPQRLAARGIQVDFLPGSATVADDAEDLRNKVFYAFIQNHLGELIATIYRSVGGDERCLWQPVAETCQEVFDDMKREPELQANATEDEAALFRPTLALKALATMRLQGQVTRYSFAEVSNPLAEFQRQA